MGKQRVCVVAETHASDDGERRRLAAAVVRAWMRIDVTIARVDLVPPRWLIKAGKPSRSANRDRVLAVMAASGA